MASLGDLVQEEAQQLIDQRDWELMSARLPRTDEGAFCYRSLGADGIESVVFSDEVQARLQDALGALQQYRDLGGLAVERQSAVWVTENTLSGDEVPDNVTPETGVYVEEQLSETWTASKAEFAQVARDAVANRDDVLPERVKSVSISCSSYGHEYTDGTVVFETKTPHERIMNVSSFDEYLEWRAEQNEDETVESLRRQEYYEDHFHPTNDAACRRACERVCERITDRVTVRAPATLEASGFNMVRDGEATATVTVRALVDELEARTTDNDA